MKWSFRRKKKPIEALTDEELALHLKQIGVKGERTDLTLRRILGYGALIVAIVQIVVADFVFIVYADNNAWELPAVAITGWLTATVVQVVGIVWVIASYLFPRPADSP